MSGGRAGEGDAVAQDVAPGDGLVPGLTELSEAEGEKPAGADAKKQVEIFSMHGVDLKIPKGSLTAIVGAVGSGKSSLLQGLIGEMACSTLPSISICLGGVGFERDMTDLCRNWTSFLVAIINYSALQSRAMSSSVVPSATCPKPLGFKTPPSESQSGSSRATSFFPRAHSD